MNSLTLNGTLVVAVALKVIVVGNGCVGKTSMITRYAKGVMTDSYKKTIGTDFFEKECTLKDSGETGIPIDSQMIDRCASRHSMVSSCAVLCAVLSDEFTQLLDS